MPPRFADDLRDEGPLADLVSGAMWLIAALFGVALLALPGAVHAGAGWIVVLAGFSLGWGLYSLWMGVHRRSMTISTRAAVTASMMPFVGVALWATGGASSHLQPLLLFTALFIAYFFPPRLAWPLVALFAVTYASPLLYDAAAVAEGFPARAAGFGVAVVGQTLAMGMLKRRLVRAEAQQRVMAERDPLTGLFNRRSFDAALERAVAAPDGAALMLFDFDEFKAINDEYGHPVGDAVLRAVAATCARAVRGDDCLARIGGDEFAVIAPGAGAAGVERIVAALEEAVADAELPDGLGAVHATFAAAVAPEDGTTPDELLEAADQRLLHRKRLTKYAI
jgi:diguanylate cyclase (GGDEF)-like protein